VLQNGFQLSSPSAPSGQLTIGTTDTPSSAPLPGTFVSKTIPGSPAPTVVVLGSNHFYRVVDPRLGAGGEVASVYALPSGAGTVIALCRTASKTFAAACERVLATVQVTVPPPRQTVHPDLAYARSLSAIMTTLNSARASLSHRLASARTPGGQAQLARLLAAAHARAASAVGALHVADASRVNAALASALHQADVAYTALSRAFAAANSDGYSKARGAVAAANSAIAADLAALKRYGYTIR
jgi:hypothetical protein